MKLRRHPSSKKTTPELLLHQLLEHIDEIESVSVVVGWSGEVDTHWSSMKLRDLCMHSMALQQATFDEMNLSREESE